MVVDLLIIATYLLIMLGVGWIGWFRAKNREDYAVAGRRLGPLFFTGTMAATVLGGASTIGSMGLGYQYGISGLWLAACLGIGLIGLSVFFVEPLIRLKLSTVTQVLELRYRPSVKLVGSVVMMTYDLMVAVTSVIAIGTIIPAFFDISMTHAIWIGGAIVVFYAFLGGMWALTMTDILQFLLMTVGLLFILMPASVIHAGGLGHMLEVLPAGYFDLTSIGWSTIFTYVLIYGLGIFIGQDIWQRVFTARNASVARFGGIMAGVYCIIWGVMGAVIGMAARVFLPEISNPDATFATVAQTILPTGIRGLVLAAAAAALMSTASACLMAASTVGVYDVYAHFRDKERCNMKTDRIATLLFGFLMLVIAGFVGNVVGALTMAYNLLVGALLVSLIGAIVWKKASTAGAFMSILCGACAVIFFMVKDGILANSPIYFGLSVSFVVFTAASLLWPDRVPVLAIKERAELTP